MIAPVIITSGEPAGIGPDLCVLLAQKAHQTPLVVIADPELLSIRAQLLGLPLEIALYEPKATCLPVSPGTLSVWPLALPKKISPGKPHVDNATYLIKMLEIAATGCLQKDFSALITAPIHKATLNQAGYPFQGHTEWLAQFTNTKNVVMMLASENVRVALATTHIPLKNVPEKITPSLLECSLRIIYTHLQRYFAIQDPVITVLGLNPHAGEEGHLGLEEKTLITPTLALLRRKGFKIMGPLSADTAFTEECRGQSDLIFALYHDQGLPAFKCLCFGKSANITLGLPFIRTSVDHGTAFERAGTGQIRDESLLYAIKSAIAMAELCL